jgi:DNA-binding winged helix-turn-helix (wHTH) protein/tetratricopeptide (TPR) repeat protein
MRYVFGGCTLDTERCELRRAGVSVELRPKVYDVLAYLVTHRDRVIPKEEFFAQLWPGQFVGEASLSSCIMAARKAVGDSGGAQHVIKTVHRRGFRFVALVQEDPQPLVRGGAGTTAEAPAYVRGPPWPHAPSASSGDRTRDGRQPSERQRPAHVAIALMRQAPLIARAQYLDQFIACLQDARTGQPRVVLIQGEAGIGKTRLLREFQALARQWGAQVCFGRCHEHLSLPYLPWMESLLAHLNASLGGGSAPLDGDGERIRWLRNHAGGSSLTSSMSVPAQSDHDKLRLLLAVSRLTIALAQRQPLVVILDDLHWADPSSIDLFSHLVFTMADRMAQEPIPLVLAVTYRPPEPASPLAHLLARVRREALCQTMDPCGFDETYLAAFIQGMALGRPSHQLVTRIHQVTAGNPLFLEELLAHLLQQDLLHPRGGALVASAALDDWRPPAHLTDVVATRLAGLSQDCRRVLTLAALLGERFSLGSLGAVSGMSEEALLDLLEDAVAKRVLLSEDQDFQFAHSMTRHVLYTTPSVARRQRLHRGLAEALERLYAGQLEAHTLEIAHHLVQAGPMVQADRVATYARRAGDQAFSVFAWSTAAQFYEAALAAAESTGRLSAQARAELHYRAGLAHARNQDAGPCLDHYDRAITGYRHTGDRQGLAQVLMDKTELQYTLASAPLGTLADIQPLEEVLDVVQAQDPRLCGRIFAVLAQAYRHARQGAEAQAMARRALALGHDLGDDDLCARAGAALGLGYLQSLHVREALDSWQRAIDAARRLNNPWLEGCPLARMPLGLVLLGQLEAAETTASAAYALTRTTHEWGEGTSVALSHLASVAVARGDFAAATRYAQETRSLVARSGYPWGGFRALLALACADALRGAWREADATLAWLLEPGSVFQHPGPVERVFVATFRQLALAYAEDDQAALDVGVSEVMAHVRTDSYSLAPLCALVELAERLAAPLLAEPPAQALTLAAERGLLWSSGWMFLIPRVLGVAATLRRQWDRAEAYFHTAVAAGERNGARPELGRTYLDYARMLRARASPGDRPRALELLTHAGAILADLEMVPFIHRVQQLTEALRRPSASDRASQPGERGQRTASGATPHAALRGA